MVLADGNTLSFSKDIGNRRESSGFLRKFAAAREGSKEQQAELLNSFRSYLRAVAVNTIGEKAGGKLSVSDLVQNALIDGCNDFDQCRASGEDEFKAWLRQILLNDIANSYRYFRRQKRDVAKEVSVEACALLAPHYDSPVSAALRKEAELKLTKSISELNSDYQLVIRLRHQEKHTFIEIGQKLSRSTDAARMLWNRAVGELSKKLSNDRSEDN